MHPMTPSPRVIDELDNPETFDILTKNHAWCTATRIATPLRKHASGASGPLFRRGT